MKDEILSLNADDVDVELLEQRLEMSSLTPPVSDGFCACFGCGGLCHEY